MIPMILEEAGKFNFIEENDIIDFIAISESTPGPFAVNIATFIGYQGYGISGAIISTLGVILPSFIVILLLVNFIEKIKDNRYFKSIIKTILPIVIGLIASAVLNISLTSLFNIGNIKDEFQLNIITLITLLIITTIIFTLKIFKKKKLAPIYTIIICASLGISISLLV
jgi:chromate transporter